MANPQWKNYQPPVQDPAILAFSQPKMNKSTSPGNGTNGGTVIYNGNNHVNNSIRETGIVEKMLHSYGFVQCCDRDARLFFHFSEYTNDIETLKIGDPVEFQMSFDRRNGKPIAVSVVKMETGTVSFEVVSENRIKGVVVTEAKPVKQRNTGMTVSEGQLSYVQNGEHFFLPYTTEDIENNKKLSQGDKVSFFLATDKRTGKDHARHVEFDAAAGSGSAGQRVQGVICSMKDSYGFIERADAVKEIFFHFSEYAGNVEELSLGDDVDFAVQSRNGKEVAVDIKSLPVGTVVFEDVGVEIRRGKIQKTLRGPLGQRITEPLAGQITYETVKGPIDIQFGDKDPVGDYTLRVGDLVEFKIATDRRDKLQRATNIKLVQDTFTLNGEQREQGVVVSTKDGYGFIRCADREARLFFHFSELLDTGDGGGEEKTTFRTNDELEFTVIPDPAQPSRMVAIRIRRLQRGAVKFETVLPERRTGHIEKEPALYSNMKSPGKKENDPGIIMYDVNGTKQMIPYSTKVVQGNLPKYGDKVEFQVEETKRNNTRTAVNVKLVARSKDGRQQGFIAAIKENYGFIESADHQKEVFFHFSNFVGDDAENIDVGDEVEFTLARKTAKVSAEAIRKLAPGTVAPEAVEPATLDGVIVRSMRIVNPEQEEYPGLVQATGDDNDDHTIYEYGITSLADKRDFLQKGDPVKFQVAVVTATGQRRATHLAAKRKFQKSKVESLKANFGFLQFEKEEGKKLFFHMTEVHEGASLRVGDEVEFVLVYNQRTNKHSACSVRKLSSSGSSGGSGTSAAVEKKKPRPERLISRLKSVGDESGPKITVLRQPKGPDGSKGFLPRKPWQANHAA